MDDWFHHRAGQDQRRDVARVFVAVAEDDALVGFYSLSATTLSFKALPDAIRKKLPRYPMVPAVLIGRLARDQRARGTGVGELLLADAIKRVVRATEYVAAFAVVVDAKDEPAAAFYRRFGFVQSPDDPMLLMLPLAAVRGRQPDG